MGENIFAKYKVFVSRIYEGHTERLLEEEKEIKDGNRTLSEGNGSVWKVCAYISIFTRNHEK